MRAVSAWWYLPDFMEKHEKVLEKLSRQVQSLESTLSVQEERLVGVENGLSVQTGHLAAVWSEAGERLAGVENGLRVQERRLDTVWSEAGERLSEIQGRLSLLLGPERVEAKVEVSLPSALRHGASPEVARDAFAAYSRFEEIFYDHDSVIAKQRHYLPLFEGLRDETAPLLDIGCGRGEFLDLLEEAGHRNAIGVDLNPVEVEKLRQRGKEAVCADALDFLEDTDRTFAAMTALQVVEHLDLGALHRLLKLAYDRLAPGGLLILETINPHNPWTLASFYMDETHRRFLPPELIAYIAGLYGFGDLRLWLLSPMPRGLRIGGEMRAYHDYALIARKPGKDSTRKDSNE